VATKNGDGWRSSELGDLNWDHKYWTHSRYISSWTTWTLKMEEAGSYKADGTTCQVTHCHLNWLENLYFEKDGSQMFSFYFWKYSLKNLHNWVLEHFVCVFYYVFVYCMLKLDMFNVDVICAFMFTESWNHEGGSCFSLASKPDNKSGDWPD